MIQKASGFVSNVAAVVSIASVVRGRWRRAYLWLIAALLGATVSLAARDAILESEQERGSGT